MQNLVKKPCKKCHRQYYILTSKSIKEIFFFLGTTLNSILITSKNQNASVNNIKQVKKPLLPSMNKSIIFLQSDFQRQYNAIVSFLHLDTYVTTKMYWRVIMKYKLPHAPARHMDKNAFFFAYTLIRQNFVHTQLVSHNTYSPGKQN